LKKLTQLNPAQAILPSQNYPFSTFFFDNFLKNFPKFSKYFFEIFFEIKIEKQRKRDNLGWVRLLELGLGWVRFFLESVLRKA